MKARVTIVLVLFAAAVGILAWLNPFSNEPEQKKEPPWFYKVTSEEITRIQIDTKKSSQAFVKKGPGQWYFEDPSNIPVDRNRWGGIPLLLSGPQSMRILFESVDDPTKFGLDNPTALIKVTLQNGSILVLRLGDETPDKLAHYTQMDGFPELFLIDSSWGQVLIRIADEPPLPKWYVLREPQRIAGLEVAYKDAQVEFSKDETGWRFKDGSAIAEDRWKEVAPLLEGPTSMEVVKDQVEDLSPYGVTQESPIISLRFKATTERGVEYNDIVSFVLGNEAPDGKGRYVYADGHGVVLSLDSRWAQVLTRLAQDPPYAKTF